MIKFLHFFLLDVNGKVIHVVQSLPPQGNSATSSSSSSSNTTTSGARISHRDTAGFVLGAFTIPQDFLDPTQIQVCIMYNRVQVIPCQINATINITSSEFNDI